MNLQGQLVSAGPHFPRDYYGRPTHRSLLMRFDYQQQGQILEPCWSAKFPGKRPLGIAPSGKFCIYLITWVPCSMARDAIASALRPWVPPGDKFILSFPDRYHWGLERIAISMPQIAMPEKERVLILAAREALP